MLYLIPPLLYYSLLPFINCHLKRETFTLKKILRSFRVSLCSRNLCRRVTETGTFFFFFNESVEIVPSSSTKIQEFDIEVFSRFVSIVFLNNARCPGTLEASFFTSNGISRIFFRSRVIIRILLGQTHIFFLFFFLIFRTYKLYVSHFLSLPILLNDLRL